MRAPAEQSSFSSITTAAEGGASTEWSSEAREKTRRLTPGFLMPFFILHIIIKIKGYNIRVIIALISMRGGEIMREFLEFILSVTASVVGYYICKWLDSKISDDN